MPRLVLVRHGRPLAPAAGTGAAHDPGLSDTGREQAEQMAERLDVDGGARPVIVSPKRRTRETAGALEDRWGEPATVEPAVGEIPLPADLKARADHLRVLFASRWEDQPWLPVWRAALVERLLACHDDTVVVSHYFAINAAVTSATDDPRVIAFRPDHCSTTVLEARRGRLRLVELGREAVTTVEGG